MALYTKKEFAELCKQATNYLSVQISRGKLIVENDKIDSENLINKSYLEKIYGRMDFVPTQAKTQKQQMQLPLPPTGPELSDEEIKKALEQCGGMDYPTLERIYKFLQGEKLKSDIEKNKIDIEKKRGEVIPADLIAPLFVQHSQSFLTSFKNVSDAILTEYGQIKKFTVLEIAAIRGRLLDAINFGMDKADEITSKSVGNIINEYSAKRGVGERM